MRSYETGLATNIRKYPSIYRVSKNRIHVGLLRCKQNNGGRRKGNERVMSYLLVGPIFLGFAATAKLRELSRKYLAFI